MTRFRLIRAHESLAELQKVEDWSVDAVVTDPPYSSGGMFRGDRTDAANDKYERSDQELKRPTFSGDNRDQRAYAYWCTLWLSECLRISREGAPICLFTDWRQIASTIDALQAGGWIWRGIVPWDKTEAARPQRGRFRAQCEYVIWGSNGPMPIERGVDALPGFFRQVVLQADKFHLTGKPTSLMRELVKICTPGGLILDPFMGSGSTGVACVIEGYEFLGIEREPDNVAIAQRRIEEAQLLTPATATQFGLNFADVDSGTNVP